MFKGETMKRARLIPTLLFALTLTIVLGGCQDKKESGKESKTTKVPQKQKRNQPWEVPL